MPDRDIRLTFSAPPPSESGDGDWVRVDGLDNDLDVHVLVEWADSKPQIKVVWIGGDTVLAEHLRAVPLGRVERELRFSVDQRVLGFNQDGEVELRPPGALTRRMNGEDDVAFGNRVAMTYRYYANRTSAPAKAIAEDSGIPVGTVRRWIREARKVGQLEPGRHGRAG